MISLLTKALLYFSEFRIITKNTRKSFLIYTKYIFNMPKKIGFVKQKGGVGASTLCLSLYFALKKFSNGAKICLLDLDPQGSLLVQKKQNSEIEVFTKYDDEKFKEYDILLIDSPPRITKVFNPIFESCDLLILPTKAGLYDAAAVIQTYQYLKKINLDNKAYVLLNQAATSSTLQADFLATLKNGNISYLNTIIHNRLGFQRMLYSDGNIFSQKRQNRAQSEIKDLSIEVYSLLLNK